MKRVSIVFLQTVIVLIGIVTLVLLIWFPLIEGRATNLDLVNIYLDMFILYGYTTSIPFFVALYNAFKLLAYIGQDFGEHKVICNYIKCPSCSSRTFHKEYSS